MKSPIIKMQISPEGLDNRFERAEERFCDLEDRLTGISNLKNREKKD